VIGRLIRRLLMVAVILVAVLVGLDFGARALAQSELASRAQSATDAQSASASISGFPFLWDLLEEGTVHGLHLHLSDVPVGQLRLQAVDVQLTDTSIERSALFSHRQVRVRAIATALATVTVTAAELSSAIGDPVTLPGQDRILIDLAGQEQSASVSVESGDLLVVSVDGFPLLQDNLGTSPLVPQCDLSVFVATGQLSVSCAVSPVPERVVQAIAGT
jgi:hypothetical protein